MAELIGRTDVDRLAFGAWASATAGRAVRGEGLPVDCGTSAAVAAGNRAIIGDVEPRFAVWTEKVVRAAEPSARALRQTLADPLFDGVPLLADAFAGTTRQPRSSRLRCRWVALPRWSRPASSRDHARWHG